MDFLSILIIGLILYIVIKILKKGSATKCSHCKKMFAMKSLGYELVGISNSSKKITKKRKRYDGKTVYNEDYVPVILKHYKQYRKCKYCGHQDFTEVTQEL